MKHGELYFVEVGLGSTKNVRIVGVGATWSSMLTSLEESFLEEFAGGHPSILSSGFRLTLQ